MELNPIIQLALSIVLMAVTILFAERIVLRLKRLPIWRALVIAATSNLLGKLFVSVLHWPAALSYSLPTLSFLLLSYVFFKPKIGKLIIYWLVGFAAYIAIHIMISTFFDWTFMFPFWEVKLF